MNEAFKEAIAVSDYRRARASSGVFLTGFVSVVLVKVLNNIF